VENARLVEMVRSATAESIAFAQEQRSEVVRRNVLTNDVKQHASRARTYDIRPGDKVSYKGAEFTVRETQQHTPSGPSKAIIETKAGISKAVNFHDLLPLADPTSELMIPTQDLAMAEGHFVFYTEEDSIYGGIITDITDSVIYIHDAKQGDHNPRMWTRLYDTDKGRVPKHKPSPDQDAVITVVPRSDIITYGEISPTRMIDQRLLDFMYAKGYLMSPTASDPANATVAMPVMIYNMPAAVPTVTSSPLDLPGGAEWIDSIPAPSLHPTFWSRFSAYALKFMLFLKITLHAPSPSRV